MELPRREAAKIAKYRAGVEVRLAALPQQAGSNITLDDYKRAIFNGPDLPHSHAYLREALEVLTARTSTAPARK
jgi:hypothetical protein